MLVNGKSVSGEGLSVNGERIKIKGERGKIKERQKLKGKGKKIQEPRYKTKTHWRTHLARDLVRKKALGY